MAHSLRVYMTYKLSVFFFYLQTMSLLQSSVFYIPFFYTYRCPTFCSTLQRMSCPIQHGPFQTGGDEALLTLVLRRFLFSRSCSYSAGEIKEIKDDIKFHLHDFIDLGVTLLTYLEMENDRAL